MVSGMVSGGVSGMVSGMVSGIVSGGVSGMVSWGFGVPQGEGREGVSTTGRVIQP